MNSAVPSTASGARKRCLSPNTSRWHAHSPPGWATAAAHEKGRPEPPFGLAHAKPHAAVSHIEVSNALLIIGMFMPKLALAAFLAATLAGLSAVLWAISFARSHDPCS